MCFLVSKLKERKKIGSLLKTTARNNMPSLQCKDPFHSMRRVSKPWVLQLSDHGNCQSQNRGIFEQWHLSWTTCFSCPLSNAPVYTHLCTHTHTHTHTLPVANEGGLWKALSCLPCCALATPASLLTDSASPKLKRRLGVKEGVCRQLQPNIIVMEEMGSDRAGDFQPP